jgi:hypothetical protein
MPGNPLALRTDHAMRTSDAVNLARGRSTNLTGLTVSHITAALLLPAQSAYSDRSWPDFRRRACGAEQDREIEVTGARTRARSWCGVAELGRRGSDAATASEIHATGWPISGAAEQVDSADHGRGSAGRQAQDRPQPGPGPEVDLERRSSAARRAPDGGKRCSPWPGDHLRAAAPLGPAHLATRRRAPGTRGASFARVGERVGVAVTGTVL